MDKTLNWIKDVRSGCKQILQTDLEKVMKNYKKGNIEGNHSLLEEIRDNEREDALLSIIQKMLEEELTLLTERSKK